MGIKNLFQIINSILKEINLTSLANSRVAIDIYSWIHKGVHAEVKATGEPPVEKYIQYCTKRIYALKRHNIQIICVFDGNKLPQKQITEKVRECKRNEKYQKYIEFKNKGMNELAAKMLSSSIDITPTMAHMVFKKINEIPDVECLVAPYEADAQLAYLSKSNLVDYIITEDADLIAYGAKKILFKLDNNGLGKLYNKEDLKTIQEYDIFSWNKTMFLTACILSGCDYVEQIQGVGVKTAFLLVQKHKNIQSILQQIKLIKKYKMPENYIQQFSKAYLTFLFQRVYCPISKTLVYFTHDIDIEEIKQKYREKENINELANYINEVQNKGIDFFVLNQLAGLENLKFLGQDIPQDILLKIVNGKLNSANYIEFSTEKEHKMKQGPFIENLIIQNKNILKPFVPPKKRINQCGIIENQARIVFQNQNNKQQQQSYKQQPLTKKEIQISVNEFKKFQKENIINFEQNFQNVINKNKQSSKKKIDYSSFKLNYLNNSELQRQIIELEQMQYENFFNFEANFQNLLKQYNKLQIL